MKTDVREVCTCGLEIRPEIWRCPHHIYREGREQYDSVSHVIRAVYPVDYSSIEPAMLENARVRGVYIDLYYCEWLQSKDGLPTPTEFREIVEPHFRQDSWRSPQEHAEDCRIRLERLLNWSISKNLQPVAVQKTVYDRRRKVAGTLDIRMPEAIYDLKCVSELQSSYRLQLGAYAECDEDEVFEVGVIHVRKDRVCLKRYNLAECRKAWANCWNWYQTKRWLDGETVLNGQAFEEAVTV